MVYLCRLRKDMHWTNDNNLIAVLNCNYDYFITNCFQSESIKYIFLHRVALLFKHILFQDKVSSLSKVKNRSKLNSCEFSSSAFRGYPFSPMTYNLSLRTILVVRCSLKVYDCYLRFYRCVK